MIDPQDLEKLASLVVERVQAISPKIVQGEKRSRARRAKPEFLPDFLTEDEINRFLGVISDPRDKAMFTIAYFRGLRASELGLMDLADYDAPAGRLTVKRLKGSRGGQYRLLEEERAVMRVWLRRRGNAPGPLFPSRNHGPITRWPVFRLMQRYCAAAGIPAGKAHPHALKHSCATHLSEKEPDILAVQDHLGHVDIRNTLNYIRITSRRRSELADRLEQKGWGSKRRK